MGEWKYIESTKEDSGILIAKLNFLDMRHSALKNLSHHHSKKIATLLHSFSNFLEHCDI